MKFYLTLTVFILLSSSVSSACGRDFFNPYSQENTSQKKVYPLVIQEEYCTACGAAMMVEYKITKGSANIVPQEDKIRTSEK